MKSLKFHRSIKVLLGALSFLITNCDAQNTSRGSILALSKADHTLAIVDPVTLNIIARIPVGTIRTR